MKALGRIAGLVTLLILGAVTMASAQARSGILTGLVVDETGAGLPAVSITVEGPALIEGQRSGISNERGAYRFIDLPPGVYSVKAELEGFTPFEQREVQVSLGVTTTVNVSLKVGSLKDEVTVVAVTPIVDPEGSKLAVNFTQDFLQKLPTSRSLDAVMGLAPGMVDRAAMGTGVKENNISLDGTYLTDPGNGQQMIYWNYDIIDEAQVATAGHNAEYGNAPGAVVNVVTKSGGDNLSGLFNYYYRDKNLRSENHEGTGLSAPSSAIKKEWEGSANLGGPILKQKIWYFGSLGHMPTTSETVGFPQDITRKQTFGFGKITTQLNPKHRVAVVYNYSSDDTDHMFADQFRTPQSTLLSEQWTSTVNAQWNYVMSSKGLFELRVAHVDRSTTYVSNGQGPAFTDLDTNMLTQSAGFGNEQTRGRLQVQPSMSYWLQGLGGDHDLKFGFTYEGGESGYDGKYYNDEQGVAFWDTQNGVKVQGTGYAPPVQISRDTFRGLSGYAQDTWKAGRRLTMNLGFRVDNIRNQLPTQDKVPTKMTLTNFSSIEPRLGASYDLTRGQGRAMAVSAHFGRYYNNSVTLGGVNPNSPATNSYVIENGQLVLQNTTSPQATSVDPDLRRPYSQSFLLGFQTALTSTLQLKVNGIFKTSEDFIGQIDLNRTPDWYDATDVLNPLSNEMLTVYNLRRGAPLSRLYYTNPDRADRDYKAFQWVLVQRPIKNVQFLFSHVWSRASGLASQGQWSGYTGESVGGTWNNPNMFVNAADGPLDMDRAHQVKLAGSWVGPHGIVVGSSYTGQSGYAYTRFFRTRLNQGNVDVNAEMQGSSRYPFQHLVDMRLEKRFEAAQFMPRVYFEAFNLLNSNTAKLIGRQFGNPTLGKATELLQPRIFRVGLGLSF